MRHPIGIVVAITLAALAGPSIGEELQADNSAPAVENSAAVTVFGSRQAESVLGREVRSKANENLGRLVDVVVDHAGRPVAAVIDFGGFLGIGNRKIAIDWNALNFANDGTRQIVTVDLTRDQIKVAPEYKDKRAVIVLGSAGTFPQAE
jgi:hypothetical protein